MDSKRVRFRWLAILLATLCSTTFAFSGFASEVSFDSQPTDPGSDSTAAARSILDLDIEQLARTPVRLPSLDLPVSTVTKQESTVGHSAAAVFVITPEMIRRSGATSIPEALRMVPGMDVAQINSNAWAVSCRGFNSAYSNKLLVMIDGRCVYNPDFSGVYWNMQDVLLDDVERIEVVRGPGGTLWGSNAVNGIINVITKKASDTQGLYMSGGGGSQKLAQDAARFGGKIGEDCYYRVYGKHFEQGPGYLPDAPADDAWRQGRFGFRVDWQASKDNSDTLTLQGDHYLGTTDNSIIPTDFAIPERQTGENVLFRWRHVYDEDTDWALQMYYDNATRRNALQYEIVRTFDIDFQYRFLLTDRHQITCGAGYRNVESFYTGGDTFTPWYPFPNWTTNYVSQFIQDEMVLVDDFLIFTLGTKLEENPYTGLECQPSARLLWTPEPRRSIWTAVTRAVRSPSRYQEQTIITMPPVAPNVYPRVFGRSNQSEAMVAIEAGFREQKTDNFSWDIAAFYNLYENLMCSQPGIPEPMILPIYLINGPRGETYGVEISGNYNVSQHWRIFTQYTAFQMHVYPKPGQTVESGNDPCNQVFISSAWDLRENLEFDLMARYVDSLKTLRVPSYITMDVRLGWRPRKHLEIAVVGQNLLQEHHWEFRGNSIESPVYATEVPRGVYSTVTWRR